MGNCSTTPHKHQRHRYISVSDDSSSNAYSPSNIVKRVEAKANHHNDDLLSLVGTSNNNNPTSPYLEMMSSPTAAKSEDKSLINQIPAQYSPIIQTPYSPIVLTPPMTTTRLVGADNDDTLALDYTEPRPQSEETIIRAAYSPTPQVKRIVSNVGDEDVDSTKQDAASTPIVDIPHSKDMNEKALVSSAPTEEVIKSYTTSQLTESRLITLDDVESKGSTIQPQPKQQTTDIAVPNIMMVSPKNNNTRLVKGVRFEKSVRDNGTQQVRATQQHLSKKETDHNHHQQTHNVTRRHQNLARFALVVLACLYMLCCGMLGWAGKKAAVSSVGVLFLDPPRMTKQINEAFDVIVLSGEQPTTQLLLDNKSSSLLLHKTKHKVSRLGMIWYTSISEELLEIDDVNTGLVLI